MNTVKKLEHYKPLGSFSTKDDVLKVFIPVTSGDFELVQKENISSTDINALILRVTDDTYDRRKDEALTHVVENTIPLTELDMDLNELRNDKKVYIMVYNSTEEFDDRELNDFKMCIKDHQDYDEIDCFKRYKDIDLVRPNEHDGNILIGV